jgi:hypothetical protein
MGEWCNALFTYADPGHDPRRWERYFLRFDPSEWDEHGDGVLQYLTGTGLMYSLMVMHWKDLGLLLQYTSNDLDANRQLCCKYAVADAGALDRFEERDDLLFPTGCFLPPATAWLAVQDFLSNPERQSKRVEWVDDDGIPWPDSLN